MTAPTTKPALKPTAPKPKPEPVNIQWGAVLGLCRRAGVGRHTAIKLFMREDSPARILLRGRTKAVYSRAVVLAELGLKETDL